MIQGDTNIMRLRGGAKKDDRLSVSWEGLSFMTVREGLKEKRSEDTRRWQ